MVPVHVPDRLKPMQGIELVTLIQKAQNIGNTLKQREVFTLNKAIFFIFISKDALLLCLSGQEMAPTGQWLLLKDPWCQNSQYTSNSSTEVSQLEE